MTAKIMHSELTLGEDKMFFHNSGGPRPGAVPWAELCFTNGNTIRPLTLTPEGDAELGRFSLDFITDPTDIDIPHGQQSEIRIWERNALGFHTLLQKIKLTVTP